MQLLQRPLISPSISSMATPNKARIFATTGAVAGITATGAWYGAGLKTRREFKQVFRSADSTLFKSILNKIFRKKKSSSNPQQQTRLLNCKAPRTNSSSSERSCKIRLTSSRGNLYRMAIVLRTALKAEGARRPDETEY